MKVCAAAYAARCLEPARSATRSGVLLCRTTGEAHLRTQSKVPTFCKKSHRADVDRATQRHGLAAEQGDNVSYGRPVVPWIELRHPNSAIRKDMPETDGKAPGCALRISVVAIEQ